MATAESIDTVRIFHDGARWYGRAKTPNGLCYLCTGFGNIYSWREARAGNFIATLRTKKVVLTGENPKEYVFRVTVNVAAAVCLPLTCLNGGGDDCLDGLMGTRTLRKRRPGTENTFTGAAKAQGEIIRVVQID